MAPLKVIIVGGGLGGSLLANGLLNNGIDTTLYERDEADSKREGYQIRLGDSALVGLKACLKESHLQGVLDKLGRSTEGGSTAPVVYDSQFRPLLDLSTLPAYSKTSAINRVVLRDMLIRPVRDAGCVQFRKGFESFEIVREKAGQETVLVTCTDGSTETCDILIGADGSGSKVESGQIFCLNTALIWRTRSINSWVLAILCRLIHIGAS